MPPQNADAAPLTTSGGGMAAGRSGIERIADPPGRAFVNDIGAQPLAVAEEGPDVGLGQKGTGETAIVRRETEI